MACRTVSTPVIQVVTEEPLLTLLAEERERPFNRHDRDTLQAKREEREKSLEKWQREWEENAGGKGQWTMSLVPQLEKWVECQHRHLNFMTQTRDMCHFAHIKKTEDDNCVYFGGANTAAHILCVDGKGRGRR